MNNIDKILENLRMNREQEIPKLNDIEKQNLLNKTMDKINRKRAVNHNTFKKTALVCAACVIFVTSAAAAAGLFKIDEIFYKYLHGSDTNVLISGENIAAKATSDGITVAARQIIGDDYGFYVIFDTDAKNNEISGAEVQIKGANVYQCSDIIALRDDPAAFMLHIISSENLQGKQISVHLTDDINERKWNLKWNIDYSDSAKKYDVSKPIEIYGGNAVWKNVSISPVSVSIMISDLKDTKIYCENPNDRITVTMNDGSTFDSEKCDDSDMLQDTDFITMSFNKIVDIGKIESVSFAGVTYKIN